MEVYPFSYVKRFAEETNGMEVAMFGLKPLSVIDFEDKIRRRLEIMLEIGLLVETEQVLQKGYRNTFVMENSFVYGPLVKFLDGLISLEEAKEEIVRLCMTREEDAYKRFLSIPHLKWVLHNSDDIEPSIRRILKWL